MNHIIQAVLFDLDGVIVFTDAYHYRAWKRLADEEGWAFDEEVNNQCRGVPRMASLEVILAHNNVTLPAQAKQALAERKNNYYKESLHNIGAEALYPGAVELLSALKARGVKLGLCSSSKNAADVLRKLRLTQLFDTVVTGHDITHAKPHPEDFEYHNLVNAALYVLTRDVVAYITPGVKADFGKDLFPKILSVLPLYGYVTPEYMKDVGTPERIAAVEQDLRDGKFARRSLSNRRPAVFLDRDGVLNKEVNLLSRVEQMELLPRVAEAVRMLNTSDYLGIVVTNQPVVARNLCTLEGLDAIHKRLETRLGEQHAWLDAIEFCPHHPDAGYPGENPEFKIECDCRKPKTGMIERSSERFNIDLDRSWIIGDSARDIECGQRAGVQTIGVRTGYGCQDAVCQPDYMFDDLYDALDFVVNDPFGPDCREALSRIASVHRPGPRLVLVAGLTRSGKTVFARRLAREMRLEGMRPLVLALDAWLIPVAQRDPADDVFTRFRTDQASHDIDALLQGQSITIHPYDARSRGLAPEPVRMALDDADAVIVEGVTALHSGSLLQRADLRIVVEAPDAEIQQRFARFYAWKGLNRSETDKLYNGRFIDEANSVVVEYGAADFRVNPCRRKE